MSYAFEFQQGTFTPDGRNDSITDTDAHNRETERKEIEWLKTSPDKVFLYVRDAKDGAPWAITTWLGTVVGDRAEVGARRYIGFDRWTYRRAVSARIFGVLYHGWYMESSGNYCKLRRAKRQ